MILLEELLNYSIIINTALSKVFYWPHYLIFHWDHFGHSNPKSALVHKPEASYTYPKRAR